MLTSSESMDSHRQNDMESLEHRILVKKGGGNKTNSLNKPIRYKRWVVECIASKSEQFACFAQHHTLTIYIFGNVGSLMARFPHKTKVDEIDFHMPMLPGVSSLCRLLESNSPRNLVLLWYEQLVGLHGTLVQSVVILLFRSNSAESSLVIFW